MNRSRYIYIVSDVKIIIKFVSMEIKSFDFRNEKKKMMKDVCRLEGFGMLKKKKN